MYFGPFQNFHIQSVVANAVKFDILLLKLGLGTTIHITFGHLWRPLNIKKSGRYHGLSRFDGPHGRFLLNVRSNSKNLDQM